MMKSTYFEEKLGYLLDDLVNFVNAHSNRINVLHYATLSHLINNLCYLQNQGGNIYQPCLYRKQRPDGLFINSILRAEGQRGQRDSLFVSTSKDTWELRFTRGEKEAASTIFEGRDITEDYTITRPSTASLDKLAVDAKFRVAIDSYIADSTIYQVNLYELKFLCRFLLNFIIKDSYTSCALTLATFVTYLTTDRVTFKEDGRVMYTKARQAENEKLLLDLRGFGCNLLGRFTKAQLAEVSYVLLGKHRSSLLDYIPDDEIDVLRKDELTTYLYEALGC